MSKDFLGFMHSVLKGNIVGNLWFGYNCQFYTQITQNWENLVISGLFKWHKFTSYPSHSAIYCVYWSKIMNISYISTYPLMYHSVLGLYSEEIRRAHLQNRFDFFVKSQRAVLHFCNLTIFRYIHEPNRQFC